MRIGIIGYGVVGKSVHNSLLNTGYEVSIYDPILGTPPLEGLVAWDPGATFIAVPTPTTESKHDITIIDNTLQKLLEYGNEGLVIIKSTILPSNMRELVKKYPDMDIIVSPEFLDQNKPYFEQMKHIIGVENIYQAEVYRNIFNLWGERGDYLRTTSPEVACMAKYVHNVYGAVKVTFFNEIWALCEESGIDYREMMGCMLGATDHISRTYTRIAVDGYPGFGGACFPKDIVAFLSQYPNCDIARGAIYKNEQLRKKEMEQVIGK